MFTTVKRREAGLGENKGAEATVNLLSDQVCKISSDSGLVFFLTTNGHYWDVSSLPLASKFV